MRPIVSDTGYRHILMMKDGRAMIGGTRIKVEYVVIATQQGSTPDEICESYEGITLGQVHSALAYYWDHKELVDRQVQEGVEFDEELRKRYEPLQADLRLKAEKWRAEKIRPEAGVAGSG